MNLLIYFIYLSSFIICLSSLIATSIHGQQLPVENQVKDVGVGGNSDVAETLVKQKSRDDVYMDEMTYMDKSDWVDPGDMFNYDATKKTMVDIGVQTDSDRQCCECGVKSGEDEDKTRTSSSNKPQDLNNKDTCELNGTKLRQCQNDLSQIRSLTGCSTRISAFTTRAINRLTRKLKTFLPKTQTQLLDEYSLQVSTYIGAQNIKVIDKFVKEKLQDCNSVEKFEDTIIDIIDALMVYNNNAYDDQESYFERFYQTDYYIYSIYAIIFISTYYIIYKLYSLSFFLRLLILSIIFLLLCFCWEWYHLYLEKVAENHATLKHAPKECLGLEGAGLLNSLITYLPFSSSSEEKCAKYYRAVFVSPILEVNPAMAITSALSKTAFYPLRILGTEVGHFYNNLFTNLPWYLKIVMTLTFPIMFIVFCIFLMGYSIKIPFLFSIEKNHETIRVQVKEAQPQQITHQNHSRIAIGRRPDGNEVRSTGRQLVRTEHMQRTSSLPNLHRRPCPSTSMLS